MEHLDSKGVSPIFTSRRWALNRIKSLTLTMGGTALDYVKRCTRAKIPKEIIQSHLIQFGDYRKMDIDWDTLPLPPTPEQMMAQMQAMQRSLQQNGFTTKDYTPPPPPPSKKQPPAPTIKPPVEDASAIEARKLRFQAAPPAKKIRINDYPATSGPAAPVVGQSEAIEKQYLRLTSAPDPRFVRPKRVLKKSFAFVCEKYRNSNEYSYIVSQLKSIRQDLKVQNIEDGFTILVYETNARIALENKDMGEFNQCLSQLNELYQKPSLSFSLDSSSGEFIAYAIYYALYTQAFKDLDKALYRIQNEEKLAQNSYLKFAMQVVEALFSGNASLVISLYRSADRMSQLALESVVRRERLKLMLQLTVGLRGQMEISTVRGLLNFDNDLEAKEFVSSVTTKIEGTLLNLAQSRPDFEKAVGGESRVDIKGQK